MEDTTTTDIQSEPPQNAPDKQDEEVSSSLQENSTSVAIATPMETEESANINANNITEKETIDLEEKRRRETLLNLEKIEKEFHSLKEKFFAEKIDSLKKEYEMLKMGTHEGFLKKCSDLEDIKQQKLWAAEKFREYQLKNLESIFESEIQQAEEEYKADMKMLRERMMTTATEKKRKLIEEKNSIHISDSAAERIMTRTLRKRGSTKDKDPLAYKRKLNPPHINYVLKDSEIGEDLLFLQKSIQSSNSSNNNKNNDRAMKIYGNSDVYVDKGKLHYFNQIFEKGNEVNIESKVESGRWQGVLVVINPAEINIKSSDMTKCRFTVSQLRNQKYTISLASSK